MSAALGQLSFDVAKAKRLAEAGDIGLVAFDGEEVEIEIVNGALTVSPTGLYTEPTPLTVRVRTLLSAI